MILPSGFGFQFNHFFGHEMSSSQKKALSSLLSYFENAPDGALFVLKGYAGTGKSSLVGALCRTLLFYYKPVVLLAPTGRAAKVLGGYCSASAYTIHRVIYRQKRVSFLEERFDKDRNSYPEGTVFIVDEASMIGNEEDVSGMFGSGRLLEDLLDFVFSTPGSKVVFIGDDAQLPPVGTTISPALDVEFLKAYCSEVHSAVLTDIVRQAEQSNIVRLGALLRDHILLLQQELSATGSTEHVPPLSPIPFVPQKDGDVSILRGEELPEALDRSMRDHSVDDVVVVTRSNKDAEAFNVEIRRRQFDYETALVQGERLMVARNNYFYFPGCEEEKQRRVLSRFSANGEVLTVKRLGKVRELYNFTFADVTLETEMEEQFEAKVIMDSLLNASPALSPGQRQELFDEVRQDYPELTTKAQLYPVMRQHPYLNALQVKYAYAMTCHKSQGGQWKDVYVYIGYLTEEMMSLDFYRWLYTAVTRATGHLYFVNPSKLLFEIEE